MHTVVAPAFCWLPTASDVALRWPVVVMMRACPQRGWQEGAEEMT